MYKVKCRYCNREFLSRSHNTWYCDKHVYFPVCSSKASNAKIRATKLGLTEHYTARELMELFLRHDAKCMCCGTSDPYKGIVADHIVSLSIGGTNTIDNIQILCTQCNTRKRNYTIDYRIFA
jgi:5-methylcytosine-specific restriction endonuclease McrA